MIWIDITNSPHVLFFREFIKRHNPLVTTRKFGPLTDLLDRENIKYISVGRHGGRDPKSKLMESAGRILELGKSISSYDIDVAISKHSVELPRVSFGLGIPCIHILDNEYAEHQNRLTLPLASKIIVPETLDEAVIIKQGATREKITKFRGVCEYVHVKGFKETKAIRDLGFEDYVLVRPEPYMASYFGIEGATQKMITAVKDLGLNVVVIPRGKEKFDNAVMVENVDSLSLIYRAKAFLGGGGTMNRESALLGTPAISFYPQELLGVDRFLIEKGLMFHAPSVSEVSKILPEVIDKKAELKKRAKRIMKAMEDPFEVIEKEVEKLRDEG